MASELLRVRDLTVTYPGAQEPALVGLDLTLNAGECVAVLGPSGAGKSTLLRALLDLLPVGSRVTGTVSWQGRDLERGSAAWHQRRGRDLGLVLQDHRQALDPLRRIGDQIQEVIAVHGRKLTPAERDQAVRRACAQAQLPTELLTRYPHALSGGQRQRANLAAALVLAPKVVLADEPTTALDLPVQRELLGLLRRLVRADGLGLILVTHDRALVPLIADRAVAIGGENATLTPGIGEKPARGEPVPGRLVVRDLTVSATAGRTQVPLVQSVSLTIARGRTLGVVGPSGAGKTTLVRAIAGWLESDGGSVRLEGERMPDERRRRREIQLVSQDASAALDPQQTIGAAVAEAVASTQTARRRDRRRTTASRVEELFAEVDLAPELAGRRPAELSGGQRQRAQLARALAAEPQYLLADEPASSLDPARRRQLLDLLVRVQAEHHLGLLLVSHDIELLATFADEVLVMVAGMVVEVYRPQVHRAPRHPLAASLLAAAPSRLTPGSLDAAATATATPITTEIPASGCPYAPRCELVQPACRRHRPPLVELADGHLLRCPIVASRTR